MKIKWLFIVVMVACFLLSTSAFGTEVKFYAKEPVLLTAAGQSADILMIKVLLERNKIFIKNLPLAQPEDLTDMKTLVIVLGGSSKGLGAAGIDSEKEHARLKRVLAKARDAGIQVLAMHIGGQNRRGELSDAFITQVIPASSYVVVVKEGDEDGFISKAAAKAKVDVLFVNKISELAGPIKVIFGK
jgi:hypothetical protein